MISETSYPLIESEQQYKIANFIFKVDAASETQITSNFSGAEKSKILEDIERLYQNNVIELAQPRAGGEYVYKIDEDYGADALLEWEALVRKNAIKIAAEFREWFSFFTSIIALIVAILAYLK